jgi:formylglycine-generating enzyme required for sulfatase activity
MFSESIVHECTDGFVYTAPVTEKRSNPWGLQHVLGNVWEWTCSAYVPSYEGSEMKCADDPTARRVVRGGSWDNFPRRVRSANRFGATVGHRNIYLGFRLARDL